MPPFPPAFKGGQANLQRRKLLRDDLNETWSWGDSSGQASDVLGDGELEAVSVLAIRMHDDPRSTGHVDLSDSSLSSAGFRVVRRIAGDPGCFRQAAVDGEKKANGEKKAKGKTSAAMYEPFGFRDAIAQPVPRGLRVGSDSEEGVVGSYRDMPLGEFVLGHQNLYGESAHCPRVLLPDGSSTPFGINGSYLAVRQIHQSVAEVANFELTHSTPDGPSPSILEKMVGRFENGSPLQTCPARPSNLDDFAYRVNDSQGFDCPTGAHIRRANPRDAFSLSEYDVMLPSRLHSILRRGRPYLGDFRGRERTDRLVVGEKLQQPCGLLFMALIADIERQFEFVQRQWIANTGFGNLRDSRDPIAGSQEPGQMSFPRVRWGVILPARCESGRFIDGLKRRSRLMQARIDQT